MVEQVASEGGALTLGGISQTPSYLAGKGKEAVQAILLMMLMEVMKGIEIMSVAMTNSLQLGW